MKTLLKHLRYWSARILIFILTILLVCGGYFYTIPQLKIGSLLITNSLYETTKDIPTWLYVVDYFTYIFIVVFILIFTLIIYYNARRNKEEKIDSKYIELFVIKIFSFLYPAEELTERQKKHQLKELKKQLRNDHAKKLLINTLRKIHAQTTGVVNQKTEYLMKELNYNSFIRANLHSPHFEDKMFALKVIADFQLDGYEKFILKLTKSRYQILHSEAVVTLLKLKVYDNLLFLIEQNMQLTSWDVNVILKTVQELKIVNIDYLTLINSEIPAIASLGIMLARVNNRSEFKMDIKKKIGNQNQWVNEEASLAFTYFATDQTDYDFLIDRFSSVIEKSQFAILYKIGAIPNKEVAIRFLDWVVIHQSFAQKIEAIRMLLGIDLNIITKYKGSEDIIIRQSYYQVLDINI